MPRKAASKSGAPAASLPHTATATSAVVPLPTAAQIFYATPELRKRMLEMLDSRSLCTIARVEKAITYDVVQVLYKEVDFGHLRSRMSRSNVSVCELIRVDLSYDIGRRLQATAYPHGAFTEMPASSCASM
jgi:hypothetical protein